MKFPAAVLVRHQAHTLHGKGRAKTWYKVITSLGFPSMSKDPENLARSSSRTQLS